MLVIESEKNNMTLLFQPGYRNLLKKPTRSKLNEAEEEIKDIFPECQIVMYEYTFVRPHTYRLFVDIDELDLEKNARKIAHVEQIIEKHFPKK